MTELIGRYKMDGTVSWLHRSGDQPYVFPGGRGRRIGSCRNAELMIELLGEIAIPLQDFQYIVEKCL